MNESTVADESVWLSLRANVGNFWWKEYDEDARRSRVPTFLQNGLRRVLLDPSDEQISSVGLFPFFPPSWSGSNRGFYTCVRGLVAPRFGVAADFHEGGTTSLTR